MHRRQMQARSSTQAPSSGVLDTSFSLQPAMILENMSLEDKSRQARRSPSPLDPGGAPASQSSCSQPASSLLYLNALEEAWSEEQELETTSHSIGLQESVGHLVLLVDSFNKGEPNNPQLSNAHVRDRACRDRLAKGNGAKQEDPGKTCSTTACRQNKQQQQLEQQKQKPLQEGQLRTADLSSEQKLEQTGENTIKQEETTANNKNSLGLGTQQRPPARPWRILVDTGAELSVAPRSFAETTQLSPCEKDLQLRTANGIAIQTFGMRTVQLLCQGFSFTMNFMIADVDNLCSDLVAYLGTTLACTLIATLVTILATKQETKSSLSKEDSKSTLLLVLPSLG